MDKSIKKMAVAIDGSETSAKALDYTLFLAEKLNAEVSIISVVPSSPRVFYDSLIFDMEKGVETLLLETLKVAKEKKPNLNISTILLKGRPAEKIVQIAKEKGFDIIVVGSRGLGGAEELFLGSVSDRVADKATCPVLIVK